MLQSFFSHLWIQEECLHRLQKRIEIPYDGSNPDHQETLRALWCTAFPGVELHGLVSEQWKDMGWQGKDPSTDFRGGGFISLDNLLFFAKTFPISLIKLASASELEPMKASLNIGFAMSVVTINHMILNNTRESNDSYKTFQNLLWKQEGVRAMWEYPFAIAGVNITFMLIQMLDLEAVDFPSVMKATRRQLERELLLEDITRIEDMPSYSLLTQ
ncbi:hypothetical protein ACLOJK_033849 [Asimina triloba]